MDMVSSLRTRPVIALIAVIAAAPAPALAQAFVANLVSATGTVEVQRSGAGEWQSAMVGTPLFALDHVRTGTASTAMLAFVDDTVIDLAPGSELTIERYTTAADKKGPRRALLRLAQGKIEAIVSGYSAEGARCEVETPTAVARVQSTRFIVRYDPTAQITEVAGIEGVVAVQGRTALIGPGVAVGPGEATTVEQGKFPSPIRALDAAQSAQLLAGLSVVGTGSREGLDVGNPLAEGRLVAATDRPEVTAAAAPARRGSYLRPSVPNETLIDSLSPDVRANTQPLPVYRAVPPNESPVRP